MTTIDSNWCRAHRDSATHWTTAHHSSPQPPTIRTHKTNTETRYLLNKETHTHTHIFELFYTKKNNTKKVCGNVCSFNREINTAVFCATSVCERERGKICENADLDLSHIISIFTHRLNWLTIAPVRNSREKY